MAFGLTVYASPDGLPAYDARLASGRWSSSTGRAFHPQDSYERFQICFLHFIPPSQACLAQSHQPEQVEFDDEMVLASARHGALSGLRVALWLIAKEKS